MKTRFIFLSILLIGLVVAPVAGGAGTDDIQIQRMDADALQIQSDLSAAKTAKQ